MKYLNRRCFMKALGVGTLGAGVAGIKPASHGRWQNGAENRGASSPHIEELAQLITVTPRDKLFRHLQGKLRDGVTYQELLGATLLAGVRDINPRPVGFKLHAVMMVGSVFSLAEAATPEQRLLPVFFNIDRFKASQERDRYAGDWVQPPPARTGFNTEQAARRALMNAMDNWQDEASDRAVIGLFPFLPRDAFFEVLWPYGARDFDDIGHKAIYTAQAYVALERIGWEHGLPVLRSLVRSLLAGGPRATTDAYQTNRLLEFRTGWQKGREHPDTSASLLAQLRTCTSRQAAETVVDMLNRGIGPQTIWDGLRLMASELLMRAPGLLPVHALTTLNALHTGYRLSRRDETKRLLLLQAASWLPLFRETFKRGAGLSMAGPGLEKLQPVQTASKLSLAEALADPHQAAGTVLALANRKQRVQALVAALRELVFKKGRDAHHFKYAAAAFEEFERSHPRWAPYILAAGAAYLPTTADRDTSVYQRTAEILRGL